MELLATIQTAWGFTGLVPRSILEVNAFGNLLVEDETGSIWRVCPEDLSCEPIAASKQALDALRKTNEFQIDWSMERLVSLATAKLGSPDQGRCFCLKIPAVLGGGCGTEKYGTISLVELISCSGELASQIKEVPDGAKVRLVTKIAAQQNR